MQTNLTISPKGQVTLPKELRAALGLKPGDIVALTISGNRVFITPKSLDFNDLAGLLGDPPLGRASLEEIAFRKAIMLPAAPERGKAA